MGMAAELARTFQVNLLLLISTLSPRNTSRWFLHAYMYIHRFHCHEACLEVVKTSCHVVGQRGDAGPAERALERVNNVDYRWLQGWRVANRFWSFCSDIKNRAEPNCYDFLHLSGLLYQWSQNFKAPVVSVCGTKHPFSVAYWVSPTVQSKISCLYIFAIKTGSLFCHLDGMYQARGFSQHIAPGSYHMKTKTSATWFQCCTMKFQKGLFVIWIYRLGLARHVWTAQVALRVLSCKYCRQLSSMRYGDASPLGRNVYKYVWLPQWQITQNGHCWARSMHPLCLCWRKLLRVHAFLRQSKSTSVSDILQNNGAPQGHARRICCVLYLELPAAGCVVGV